MKQGFFEDQTEQKLDQIKQNSTAMLVVVRLRPLTVKQIAVHPVECARSLDSKLITFVDPNDDNEKKRNRETQFAFDFVFDKHSSTKQIYDSSLTGFLEGVLDGFNSTILAYGATGCGKTYTQMIGEHNNEGLCALFLIDLLGRAQQLKMTHHVALRLSYIEIYNEVIKDLLISEDKHLQLREDPKQGVYAQGATEVQITSLVELVTLLKVGAANRSKEATGSNEASSRSHALLTVKAETKQKARGIKQEVNIGKLSLVDLAGSERAVGGKNSRQIEGAKINKSLLTLGNCIQILAEGNKSHVPFRQSKLTRLLKETLGGNCRTAMVTCISPYLGTREQTYNTLLYASRARNIGSSITRNVLSSQAHLSSYVSLISNLKRENDQLKKQIRGNKNHSLPQLKVNGSLSQLEGDRLSGKIESHFAKQLTLIRVVHELNLKLDKTAFKLLKMEIGDKKAKDKKILKSPKLQKLQQSLRNTIEQHVQQKQTHQTKLQDLILRRGTIVEQIKNGEWGTSQVSNLFNHYREHKISTELEQVKLREKRITTQRHLKDDMFSLIGQEIKVRDKIIEEQRIIIQKNNIVNRISYSRLMQSQVIPAVEDSLSIPIKQSIFKDLSEDYSQSISKKRKIPQVTRNGKNMPIKRSYQQIDSIRSEYSNGKHSRVIENDSPKKGILKQSKNSSSLNKIKSSQFDHVYVQR